jgi:hypothetical protein
VIALIETVSADNCKNRRVTFETGSMQLDAIQQVANASETAIRILECHAADQPMDLIAKRQQMLGQITAVLSCYSSDQSFH